MSYLINDLRNSLKSKYDKNQSTSVSIEALHEIQNVFAHTSIMLSQGNLERTVNYAHFHDLWIQNEYKQLNNNYYNGHPLLVLGFNRKAFGVSPLIKKLTIH